MSYQFKITSEDIISELTYPDYEQCLNCEECGDIIAKGELYWDVGGEVLCDHCHALKYQRRNGSSMF